MNGNTLRTGKCFHCGKTKEDHYDAEGTLGGKMGSPYCHKNEGWEFYDSGLAALDAHKEELYEAARDLVEEARKMAGVSEVFPRLENILNQIEKEKCSILNQIEKEK